MRPFGAGLALLFLWVATPADAVDLPPLTQEDVTLTAKRSANMRFYPELAWRAGVEGRARVLCTIAANGDLTKCSVVDEDPKACGFGEAIVRLATSMRASRRLKDGSSTAGRQYGLDLQFKLPSGTPVRAMSC